MNRSPTSMVGTIEGVGTVYVAMTQVRAACDRSTASTTMTTHSSATDMGERFGPEDPCTSSRSRLFSGIRAPGSALEPHHSNSPSGPTMEEWGKHHIHVSPGWTERMTLWPVSWKWAVACLPRDESQQPTCPQIMHWRRWTHSHPSCSHSWQPLVVLGGFGSIPETCSHLSNCLITSRGQGPKLTDHADTAGVLRGASPPPGGAAFQQPLIYPEQSLGLVADGQLL